MSKYKNKDGIELNYTGDDIHTKLVKEVVSEAVKLCSEYDWSNEVSMRFALQRTKDFLKENFDLGDKNER